MRLYLYARKAKEKKISWCIYILVIYIFFLYVLYIVLQYFFLCCCKVQYLVDILIKAKALVLNRNYISTQSVMQMKKKSYIKFYFSFIYNYLNWLSYIHTKKKNKNKKIKKKIINNIFNHNIMCAITKKKVNLYLEIINNNYYVKFK